MKRYPGARQLVGFASLLFVAEASMALLCGCNPQNAQQTLKNATVVESYYMEPPRPRSKNGTAFLQIMRLPNKRDLLSDVFEHSRHLAGKIYALAGLYEVDRKSYYRLKQKLPAEGSVVVWGADAGKALNTSETVRFIETGTCIEFSLGIPFALATQEIAENRLRFYILQFSSRLALSFRMASVAAVMIEV